MAEEPKTATTETDDTTDYKAKFEEMSAKYSDLKSIFDKNSSEVAEYKRKERERMSEDEKKAAAEAERDKEIAELRRRVAMSDYADELDDISDVKTRTEIVELFADGKIVDALKKFKMFRAKDRTEMEKRIKDELMKQNPQSSAQGGTTAKTKAEIMAIADAEERQKAIAENIHLFT